MKPRRLKTDQKNRASPAGPELLKEILGRLFAARGWGRRQERLHIEKAWAEAVGPEWEMHTRVLGLRRGVLEVEVDNGVLLQELAHFHKRRLLEQLRSRLAATPVNDLRLRAGSWKH
jgi:predicted nucleic acid-binding Zn ribbon protein